MNKNELNNEDLNKISGGKTNLDKYLKTLVGKDKDDILVDYGTGTQIDLNPSVDIDDNNNVYVIKREKDESHNDSELNM